MPYSKLHRKIRVQGVDAVDSCHAGSADRVPGKHRQSTGSIRGRVSDPVGAPVAHATVKVENAQTGFNRTVDTGGRPATT